MAPPLIHIGVTHNGRDDAERLIVGFDGDCVVYQRRHPGWERRGWKLTQEWNPRKLTAHRDVFLRHFVRAAVQS
jgi:hypothetical protein